MKKVLSLILCVLFVLTALCACGEKSDSPRAVVTASLDALKTGNTGEDSLFNNIGNLAGDDKGMYNALFGSMTYTVNKERVDGDTAEVELDVSTVDIPAALGNYLTEASKHANDSTWDTDGSFFISMLSSGDAARKSFAVTAHLSKIDGKWVLTKDGNTDLLNAVTGGLYDYANTQIEE